MATKTKLDALINKVSKPKAGFPEIQRTADLTIKSESPAKALDIARDLLESPVYQARMLATYLLGRLAGSMPETMKLLRQRVSRDPDWRVQEALAQTFDTICEQAGYQESLPLIKDWLGDDNPSVRRAATEGLRVWTSRPYFKANPEVAITLLRGLRADESEYVRRSVGGALKDIAKKHKTLVNRELKTWDLSDKKIQQTKLLVAKSGGSVGPVRKTVVKKAAAKKAAPKKATGKKAASKKAVKKTAVKKATPKKAASRKSASKKVAKKTASKKTVKKTVVKKKVTKKTKKK
ncbi:MAG: HEAT repeat domain-containing protein [Anaerolineales bacterium]|nr:HEAT repeat domain-containing protein [Anaerolineales bacterium]